MIIHHNLPHLAMLPNLAIVSNLTNSAAIGINHHDLRWFQHDHLRKWIFRGGILEHI